MEGKKKPRIVERKAEQSCSHPPHPHSKVPPLLQAALLRSRTPAKARARSRRIVKSAFLLKKTLVFTLLHKFILLMAVLPYLRLSRISILQLHRCV